MKMRLSPWKALVFAGWLTLYPVPSLLFSAGEKSEVAEGNWQTWVPDAPPKSLDERRDLGVRLRGLPANEQSAAMRYIFDFWDVKYGKEWHEVRNDGELALSPLVVKWAKEDFEPVFRRVEEWEGYNGNSLRVALVGKMAEGDPVKAGRFMSERLNPLSTQYYYYVLIHGLVPHLKDKPMSVVMPALDAGKSGNEGLDRFRWGDSAYQLVKGERPWKSPDLAADWRYLMEQKPGLLRDIMLGVVLRIRLQHDTASAITTDILATGARLCDMDEIVRGGFPIDVDLALKLLPEASPQLMDFWVKMLVKSRNPPKWDEWAENVLRHPSGARRDAALTQLTRLWLQAEDQESAARHWSLSLQDERAKVITQREVLVADLAHRAADAWNEVFEEACAIPEPDVRRRALLEVFRVGLKETREEIEARAKAAMPDAKDGVRLLDAWTLGRLAESLKEPMDKRRAVEIARMELSLQDRCALMGHTRGIEVLARLAGLAAISELIRESQLDVEERHRIQQQQAINQIDAILVGTQAGEGPGGFRGALDATVEIDDPHLRFIQQRALVHQAVRADAEEARFRVEHAKLDASTRARLVKEWERVSRWARPQR